MSKLAAIALFILAATASAPAPARTFPDHPIKVMVAYPSGAPTDTVARILTRGIAKQLGQSMIVKNVAGDATQRWQGVARETGVHLE